MDNPIDMSFLQRLLRTNSSDSEAEGSPFSSFLRRMSPHASPKTPRKEITCSFEKYRFLETRRFGSPLAYSDGVLIYVDPHIAEAYLNNRESVSKMYRDVLDVIPNIEEELTVILTWFDLDNTYSCRTNTITCEFFTSSEEDLPWVEE